MGVALSVTSLIMALAQDQPDQYKGSYVKAAARMKRILVDGEWGQDYLYYKVPCPWLQVKLLRLLQYFPPSGRSTRYFPAFNLLTVVRGHAHARSHSRIVAEDPELGPGNAQERATKQCSECRSVRGDQFDHPPRY